MLFLKVVLMVQMQLQLNRCPARENCRKGDLSAPGADALLMLKVLRRSLIQQHVPIPSMHVIRVRRQARVCKGRIQPKLIPVAHLQLTVQPQVITVAHCVPTHVVTMVLVHHPAHGHSAG